MNTAEEFIKYAINIKALELVPEGRKLKGGRISPYFFNSGSFNTGESLLKLSEVYVATVKIPVCSEVIFGPSYKGISLSVAVAINMWKRCKVKVGFSFNRKETKDHGEGGIIVGHPLVGKNVCIVDDVITTGTSLGEAVNIINLNGGFPIACIIAFDRQESGTDSELSAVQEFTRNYKVPVRSVANLADLISVLKKDTDSTHSIPNGKEVLKKILLYRDKYGIK